MSTDASPSVGDIGSQTRERNLLLRTLEPEAYERIMREVEPLELPHKQVLWPRGAPIRSVYFPQSAVISLVLPSGDERAVEAATVGNEGVVGVPIALGVESTTMIAMSQVSGAALRMAVGSFREFLREDSEFRFRVLAYAHTLLELTAQSIACNQGHELSERCARWLLMTHDRVGQGVFVLTQEFLAMMLGVRRASVTVAAGMLQQAGFIRYSRGRVEVLDRDGLERAACECYRIITDSYARSLKIPIT
jgi:CRP-like cAMP-binding protein